MFTQSKLMMVLIPFVSKVSDFVSKIAKLMSMRLFATLIVALVFQSGLYAAPDDLRQYQITNYSVTEGLPMNYINRMVQDDNGYIYFTSLDGIGRFDGYEFDVFNSENSPGLTSNRFLSIHKSQQNELWLITDIGTVSRKKEYHFSSYDAAGGHFDGNAIHLSESDNGQIWISTTTGLFYFDEEADRFIQHNHPKTHSETFLTEPFDDSAMMVLNRNGLLMVSADNAEVFIHYDDFPIPISLVTSLNRIHDDIWVTGGNGLFRYNLSSESIEFRFTPDIPDFRALSVNVYRNNQMLFNTSHAFYLYDNIANQITSTEYSFFTPLFRGYLVFEDFDGNSIRITPKEVFISGQRVLETNDIQFAMLDREGGLWVATFSRGVYHIRKSGIRNLDESLADGIENLYPVIETSDGSIWTGGLRSGIFRIRGSEVTNWNSTNSGLEKDFGRFLYKDQNTLYAGIWGDGLWKFSDEDWIQDHRFSALFDVDDITVEAMHRTQSGDLLIGTTQQLVVIRNDSYSLMTNEKNPEKFHGVRVIREDENGALYFGTNGNGLSIIRNGQPHNFNTTNSELTSNLVRDIFIQSADTIWVATENRGLVRMVFSTDHHKPEFFRVTTGNGLSHNSLHRIITDRYNFLWISTNGGIMRISLAELNRFADGKMNRLSVLSLTEKDGMINREANGGVQTAGVLSSNGLMYFPNQKGLTVINPDDFLGNTFGFRPEPEIKYVAHSGNIIQHPAGDQISMEKGIRNLRIKMSAPNFHAPDVVQFRYKLDGIVDYWEDVSATREAVLTNLSPGKHILRMEVMQSGLAESQTEKTFLLIIPPYFHETAAFYALMLLMLAGFIAGIVRYRTHSVEKRKAELQRQVDHQTLELKEAAEQKSRFFSGITHELKTPLSLIINPVDELLEIDENQVSDKVKNRLQLIKRSGIRLNQLTDQILDITKLNADAIKMHHVPVDIQQLTRRIAGQFESHLSQQNVSLIYDFESDMERIYLDSEAYERIIINLMTNAIRFSPDGGSISIKISSNERTVSVEVSDEGPGIPKTEQSRIFEYLYQVDGAKASEGTGIGLYLVKGLIEHMNGRVEVFSEPGKGASFRITLKKGYDHIRITDIISHEPIEVKPANPDSKIAVASSSGFYSSRETILIVEDNADYRKYLVDILSENYNVKSATEGKEALSVLETNQVNLVLSDMMMPGMDGLEFVSQLRLQDAYRHLPVIFLSAKRTAEDIKSGLGSGADVYLTKPIENKMLLTQIAAVLRREKLLNQKELEENVPVYPFKNKVHELIVRHMANPGLSGSMLADALYISRATLYRDWKEVSDVTLNDYIKQVRLNEAKLLITENRYSVKEAARAVGFLKANYFATVFKKHFGIAPSKITQSDR